MVERGAPDQAKKGFLRDVFGGIHDAGKAIREAEHLPMVSFEELSKGFGLAAGSPREKSVLGIALHESLYMLFRGRAK